MYTQETPVVVHQLGNVGKLIIEFITSEMNKCVDEKYVSLIKNLKISLTYSKTNSFFKKCFFKKCC